MHSKVVFSTRQVNEVKILTHDERWRGKQLFWIKNKKKPRVIATIFYDKRAYIFEAVRARKACVVHFIMGKDRSSTLIFYVGSLEFCLSSFRYIPTYIFVFFLFY